MRKEFKPRIVSRRNEREEIMSTKYILNRWKRYFKDMLDGKDEGEEASTDGHLTTQLARTNNEVGDSEKIELLQKKRSKMQSES